MPTSLVEEIRAAFANLTPGYRGLLSSLPLEHPAWAYVTQSGWGVALRMPGSLMVSERFSGARIYTEPMQDGHELRLESHGHQRRQEFAVVCAQFLEPGEGGEQRDSILADPAGWWKRWRELLGNAQREKKPYSVVGELLAFEHLLASGEEPVWLGPSRNSHDIETPAADYEVKSTVLKYSSTFRVAGQFQLTAPGKKPLFLVYQRFEPSMSGHSINDVVGRLAASGQNITVLEQDLEQYGYENGASDRQRRYNLLESMKYPVDKDFPRITPASFVGGTLPPGVVSVEYDVDLAGLVGTPFGIESNTIGA